MKCVFDYLAGKVIQIKRNDQTCCAAELGGKLTISKNILMSAYQFFWEMIWVEVTY